MKSAQLVEISTTTYIGILGYVTNTKGTYKTTTLWGHKIKSWDDQANYR